MIKTEQMYPNELPNPKASVVDENLWSETAQKLEAARFLAIGLVIWEHTLVDWQQWPGAGPIPHAVSLLFEQIGRQGTVIFFFISGFFLSKRLADDTVWWFLRRRWETIIRPWMIFVAVCVFIQVFGYCLALDKRIGMREVAGLMLTFFNGALFYAGYWFVTMSVFSGVVLVILKRYRHHIGLGIVLLTILLGYNVNLYLGWFTSNHAKAFMGYVFYVWMGVQFSYYLNNIVSWINGLSRPAIFILMVILMGVSALEGEYLSSIGSDDPFGSIRITNGIASMLLFLFFFKTMGGRRTRIVFGMYLIHIIVLVLLTPLARIIITNLRLYEVVPLMIAVQIVWYVFIMMVSYYLTKLVGKSSWRWVIGDVKLAAPSKA